MTMSDRSAIKAARYIADGVEGLGLSLQEIEKFKAEVEEEVPDWARDEDGKIVLILYYKEAVHMVRESWLEDRAKKKVGVKKDSAKKTEVKKGKKETKK